MRLGRLPHDPAAACPSLASHRLAAFAPPPVLNRSHVEFEPGLYHNDLLPCCTAAGLANAASAVAAINGYTLAIDPDLVPAFYAACIGCEPTDAAMAATDGAVMRDVLLRQVQHGFNIGPQSLVGLFGALPLRRSALASSMARLGHAYIGVTLRERDMEGGATWTVSANDGAVVGGHAVTLFDYTGLSDDDMVRVATWGRWVAASWAWIEARTDEAYGLVWRGLANANGRDIGVDPDVLAGEIAALA